MTHEAIRGMLDLEVPNLHELDLVRVCDVTDEAQIDGCVAQATEIGDLPGLVTAAGGNRPGPCTPTR